MQKFNAAFVKKIKQQIYNKVKVNMMKILDQNLMKKLNKDFQYNKELMILIWKYIIIKALEIIIYRY